MTLAPELRQSSLLARLRHITGLDRAIAYTVLARGLQIVGSAGTVLLIVRYLSSVEQGYYYTLLSLVALQTIFELGFSFVILQLAAHETVHLKISAQLVAGDSVAHQRLASILQTTVRWYFAAALIMTFTLLPLGTVFFSRHAQGTIVAWQGPWIVAVLATVLLFVVNPIFSFLEGCGQIREVAGMRFWQGAAAIVVPWSAMIAHRGLYAPGLLNAGFSAVGIAFLWRRRNLILGLLRHRANKEHAIRWRTEVWPFQWQTAISFLSSYFTVQVFTPILFAWRGPVEAGKMGMSMSVAAYLWTVVISWTSTKATPFGALVAKQEFDRLDHLFFRTLRQSIILLLALLVVCMSAVIAAQRIAPRLAVRMVTPWVFALLLLSALSTLVVQSQAIYLRSHKSEPFLWQSLIVASLTCAGCLLAVPRWGITGAALTYFGCTGVLGLWLATWIFRSKRLKRNSAYHIQASENLTLAVSSDSYDNTTYMFSSHNPHN